MLCQATVVLILLVTLIALDDWAVELPPLFGKWLPVAGTPIPGPLKRGAFFRQHVFLVVHSILPQRCSSLGAREFLIFNWHASSVRR